MPDNEEELEQSDQAAEPTAEETSEPASDSVEPAAEEVSEPTAEATEPPAEEAAPARRRAPRTPRTGARATGRQRGDATAVEEPPADPADDPPPPPRMRDLYRTEIVPTMMREFGFTNPMQVPRIQKIAPTEFVLGRSYTGVARRRPEFQPGDLLEPGVDQRAVAHAGGLVELHLGGEVHELAAFQARGTLAR